MTDLCGVLSGVVAAQKGCAMGLMDHILDLAQTPSADLPAGALAKAKLSFLDWLVCGYAGACEPVAQKLHAFAAMEGGTPAATLFDGSRAPARMAALVNGTASHALDFDDTHFAHVGHLSVAIYPAALAMGEAKDAPLRHVLAAFLVGAEAAIRIGLQLGATHYNAGFHQTATAGAFGATVAAGRVLGLDRPQMRAALGLCATRAAGLKSQFGTMGKPWNAGNAAANGVECAVLAQLGMTSADDGLDGAQGFLATHHAGSSHPLEAPAGFFFEDNLYKFYACCHGTHAMIEALLAGPYQMADVQGLTLRTNPRWLQVCDVKSPRTGLEVKFSYAWLAGMALRGDVLGDRTTFSDACAQDPALADFADRVTVVGDDSLTDLQCAGHVTLRDGTIQVLQHDLATPLPNTVLAEKLRAKATALMPQQGPAIWALWSKLDDLPACDVWRALTS